MPVCSELSLKYWRYEGVAGVGEFPNLQILEVGEGDTSDIERAEGNEVILNHQQSHFTQYYYTLLFNVPVIDSETMHKNIRDIL